MLIFKNPSLWWKFEGKHLHRDIWIGIKNLIKWFPIIWKDKNWDHSYILYILEKKIQFQSEYMLDKKRYVGVEQDVKNMKICINLIKRLRDSYYETEYMDYIESNYDFEEIEHEGEQMYEMKSDIVKDNTKEYFDKYPLIYKRVINGEGVFSLGDDSPEEVNKIIALNISHINHDRCRKLLFKIMEENIERWWD